MSIVSILNQIKNDEIVIRLQELSLQILTIANLLYCPSGEEDTGAEVRIGVLFQSFHTLPALAGFFQSSHHDKRVLFRRNIIILPDAGNSKPEAFIEFFCGRI
jgi:hypothetical protein